MSASKDPPPRGERFPLLVSYAYLRQMGEGMVRQILDCPWFDLMLDSGAFSAANSGHEIPLEEYCSFLARHGGAFFQVVALDKLGDPAQSEANLKEMIRRGLRPMPVHVLGDGAGRMDELFGLSDRVCLGGLMRPGRGHADAGYLRHKMAWAKGRPVHWLGYVKPEPIQSYRPFSCDSSSWTYGQRYGKLMVYLGGGRFLTLDNTPAERAQVPPSLAPHLDRLGFTAMDFRNPVMWRRNLRRGLPIGRQINMAVNADSFVRYSLDIRQRFGTRLFLALRLAMGEWAVILRSVVSNAGGKLSPGESKDADSIGT